jgi:predicted DNA-binding transcriptional regulator YafY
MPRGEQIQRQWNLLRMLQTRGEGIPLAQLANECDVSERTIQRDLELLQELGFPVEFGEDEYGKRFWRMPADFFKTGPLTLSLTEAISLHLAERVLAPLAGTHFVAGLQSIQEKIRSLMPAQAMDYFSGLGSTLLVRPVAATDFSRHSDIIKTLHEATLDEQTVEVEYHALWRGDRYKTLYDPYGLVLHLDDLFVVGRSHRADAVRIFKVSRIFSAGLTASRFERPEGFDLETFFRGSFGIIQADQEPIEIAVQFKGVAAAVVEERIWHDSQKLEWLPATANLFDHEPEKGHSLVATFKLAEVIEFKRWLKGFGDQAVVLRPEWLRREIRDELLAAAARYEG